jgi:hexosaminidase
MKKWLVVVVVMICSCSNEEPRQITVEIGKVSILPQPRYTDHLPGQFLLTSDTKIRATTEDESRLARVLNRALYEDCRIHLDITDESPDSNVIQLSVLYEPGVSLPEEYLLRVQTDKVDLIGSDRGVFFGIQSLTQLLPLECKGAALIPAVEIYDSPRFPYRGMHLDVARHFMPPYFIKRYIRLLSQYKFNYFHWHLTDDQGWRIEIKKYPLLTEIGSKRPETVIGKNYDPYRGDRKPVEGFYTQQDIRDIVEFARRHYITIVPEIDMPGHSSAILAAYPNLGCNENYKYRVKTTWGGFPDVLCPSEETFEFVGDVLDEIIGLFPNSPYIHIGADEVDYDHWATSNVVKEVMRANGFQSHSQVYSWFLRRVEEQVNVRGRQMIGWDEMLEAPNPPNAVVMSWQGMGPGIKAANSGREVIMSPNSHTYFDRPQSNSPLEPLALGSPLSLRDVYSFDPVPLEIGYKNRELVLGAQGCIWTEFIKRPRDVEYMAFPRAIALAEVLWSPTTERNFVNFQARLKDELLRLDRQKVNYRKTAPVRVPNTTLKGDLRHPVLERPNPKKPQQKNKIGGQ